MLPSGSKPYIIPFATFVALLGLGELINAVFKGHGPFFIAEPQYWIFPLQTVLAGILVGIYSRSYNFGAFRKPVFTLVVAVLVLILWVSPQEILGFPPRTDGFDPSIFENNPTLYWLNLTMRFVRLVIVAPLIEEIFWRGFLLRYLTDENFLRVPFGKFTWPSFLWISVLFGFEHAGPDLVPAIVTGAAFNAVAYRTRSLTACVVVHAVVNLLLGLYVLQTRQWGFW